MFILKKTTLSFGITSAIFALMFSNTFSISGGSQKRKKVKLEFSKIFVNKKILFVIFYAFVFQAAFGCYTSFCSVFMLQLGYDNGTIGQMMCITALSEIPVLILIDRLMKRFQLLHLLIFSGFMLVVRMILPLTCNFSCLILSQCLQGLPFMLMYYCPVMFLNENLGEELIGTGMALLCMVKTGLASLFSNILGGFMGQRLGLKTTFLIYALVLFTITLACLLFFRRSARKQRTLHAP